jgi:glycosyltransferase involved in cell wall biosynthesis
MKILVLSNTFPYPPTRGGTQVRTFNLLKHIAQNYPVTLITQQTSEVTRAEIEALNKYADKMLVFTASKLNKPGISSKIRRFSQFIQLGTPPNVLSGYSEEIQSWVNQAVADQKFELIICEHSANEIYIRPEWQKQLKTVVNIHSSVYRTCQNQLQTGTSENQWRDRLYLPLLYRYEKTYCQKFSHLVVTTAEDGRQIQTMSPQAKISVVPNGVDLEMFPYRQTNLRGHKLIITGGMDYVVNIDAACFFSLKVLPRLQKKYPDTTLTIVGSNPAPKVRELDQRPGIKVTGRVPSMGEYLHQANVCVVPMRSGFGIKNKTLEAMAAGVPVVASDRGLEGLEVDRPLRALRANTVEEYIEAMSRLFENPGLGQEMAHNARSMIEREYTWEKVAKDYERALITID